MAGSVEVDVSQIRRVARGFRDGERVVMREMTTAFTDTAADVRREFLAIAPTGRGENPGRYRAGFETRTIVKARDLTVQARATAPHSHYVEEGRRGFRSKRPNGWLRFVSDGFLYFAKEVGPAKGQHVMRRTLEAAEPHFRRRVAAAGQRIVAKLLRF